MGAVEVDAWLRPDEGAAGGGVISARWERIKKVVGNALELPAGARAAFVAEACGGDMELEAEIDGLLREAGGDDALATGGARIEDSDALSVWIGRQLGCYEITEEMPGGGMGRVFLAKRIDGQFDTVVAIKILRSGIDTKEGRQRFSAERQIVAALRHPNIAHLLDGGTIDGLPYFVMEYVDGEPIDQYCAQAFLDVKTRLRLFCDVCRAVESAHQQLIVHRDLKPENILVKKDGAPKLLDFGIAKFLNEDGVAGARNLTVDGGIGPYTPCYAAPEQFHGQPVSMATDVYSLGCVLYRLLTGRVPFQVADENRLAWIQAVCAELPALPSQAVQAATQDDLQHGGLPAAKTLAQALRGDLDLILLKALGKEADTRYATVAELRADIERYLRGRPVLARKLSFAYVALKFARRNRLLLGAFCGAFLAAVAGVAGIAWQAHIASTMRQHAEDRLHTVQDFSEKLIFQYEQDINVLPGGLPVAKRLMTDAASFLDKLNEEKAATPEMRMDLASAYVKLAAVQGDFHEQNLGEVSAAGENRVKALAIFKSLLAAQEADPHFLPPTSVDPNTLTVKKLLVQYAVLLGLMRDDDERLARFDWARMHLDEALGALRKAEALAQDDATIQCFESDMLAREAAIDGFHDGKYDQATALNDQALAIARRMVARDAADLCARKSLATALTNEGLFLQESSSNYAEARKRFVAAIEQQRLMVKASPNDLNYIRDLSGNLYRVARNDLLANEVQLAKSGFLEADALVRPMLENSPQNMLLQYTRGMVASGLVNVYLEENAADAAETYVREMRETRNLLLASDPQSYDALYFSALASTEEAKLAVLRGDPASSKALFAQAMETILPIAKIDNSMAHRLLRFELGYGEFLLKKDHAAEAVEAFRRATRHINGLRAEEGEEHYRRYLARAELDLGKTYDALYAAVPARARAGLRRYGDRQFQAAHGRSLAVNANPAIAE